MQTSHPLIERRDLLLATGLMLAATRASAQAASLDGRRFEGIFLQRALPFQRL